MTAYMLDTNVFDRLADGDVSFDAFRGLPLLATHVQWGELNAAKEKYPERAAKLLAAFEKIDPRMDPTASAVFDVSNWDQSSWSAEDGVVEQMLERLTQLDAEEGKKHRDPKNRIRDVLIGHTAIKNKATLISDDPRLRRLVSEFGGRAISTSDIRQGYARARWKVGLFRVWIVGSICWAVYFLWSDAAEVEDWTCWRRLLGIDEGPRCAVDTKGLIEALSELFGPPLVAGIALLAIAWIVTGFQRRAPATHRRGAKMEFLKGVHSGFTAAGPIWERGTVHFVGWLVGSATADSNNGLKTENNLKGTRPRGS